MFEFEVSLCVSVCLSVCLIVFALFDFVADLELTCSAYFSPLVKSFSDLDKVDCVSVTEKLKVVFFW